MTQKKVLHITPWYPSDQNPAFAIWIQRHIECLSPHFDQHILHLDIDFGGLNYKKSESPGITHIRIRIPIMIWRVREWMFLFVLMSFCIRRKVSSKFDIVNFHIAYPACIHIHRIASLLPSKKVITEHWSYYHYHFHSKRKLTRVKKIFQRGIPIITVSDALARDIENFCGSPIPFHVIPNVVDNKFFFLSSKNEVEGHFLMAAFWKPPKNPFTVLHGISVLKEKGAIVKLRIAGYGPLWEQLKSQVEFLGLSDQVDLIGSIDSKKLGEELNKARAFLLPSDYETFSVVCAEALCCGCPVLSDPIGALPELVTLNNGMLREEEETWSSFLERFLNHESFDRSRIAEHSAERFSKERVGEKYSSVLNTL